MYTLTLTDADVKNNVNEEILLYVCEEMHVNWILKYKNSSAFDTECMIYIYIYIELLHLEVDNTNQ